MKKIIRNLEAMRHSCEHVLHQAMVELFPGLKRAMGPATDEGFYHDFDYENKVSEADFPKIEKRMREIIKADLPIVRQEISIANARKLFKDNQYKQEWLDEIQKRGEKATVYWTGEPGKPDSDLDLCKGPHVKSTGEIGPFKLLSVAGAYWHGDEKNKMLTRIYGTCFPTQKELDQYLWQQEEAKKRDHRVLGKKLNLFSFHPEAPGDVFWHPKGLSLMLSLYDYWRKIHREKGYLEVRTPEILTKKVWDQSGHTKFYIEKIYKCQSPDSKVWNYCVKPMNCNGGILIYKTKPWSYKEFPLKMGEIGVVHRYEASGELHGIIRPREFTQDDAHIFCTPKQIKSELKGVIDLCFEFYDTFGLKLDHLELSTRPEKSIGSDEAWANAETIMRQVLKEKKVPYQINEGEGAFYGPKFDFHLKDCLGRTWQCATIQLDFAQPENFNLEYVDEKGRKKRPVMIHRVVYGSIERFLGILIEHYAGAFPVWLAPVQVVIIPISEKQNDYTQKVKAKFEGENLRGEIDERSETMQKKIKEAEEQKIPYMLIVGEREVKENKVSVRQRGEKDLGPMNLGKFIKKVALALEEKR
jgi:threonyl-tRNA synthetase